MDKIKINYAKSVPFVWDDEGWMQDAMADMIKGICSAYGSNFIVSGCQVTITVIDPDTNNHAWTAGYIVLDNELLKVDAGSIDIDDPNHAIWQLKSSWDASGVKVDSVGSSIDCYEVRRAKVVSSPTAGLTATNVIKRIENIIASFSDDIFAKKNEVYTWTSPNYQNGWTGSPSSTTGFTVVIRVDQFGYLEIIGNIIPTNATSSTAFILPTGFYNTSTPGFMIGTIISHSGALGSFKIDNTGAFILTNYSPAEAGYYINIRFKLF